MLFLLLVNLFFFVIGNNIPVYVALHQKNIDVLKSKLSIMSDPYSSEYGNWLSKEEVDRIINPNTADQDTVADWIRSYHITQIENHGDTIKFWGNNSQIRNMFSIGEKQLVKYSIPDHLQDIIEFVEMSSKELPKNTKINRKHRDRETDDRYVGRESIDYLYNISRSWSNNVSIGAIEYQNNAGFTNNDVNLIQVANNQSKNNVSHIVGVNEGEDAESELDVQMISQTGDDVSIWYWNSPYWLYSFAIDFYNSKQVPNIISMSWGWAEDSQCDIIDCVNITSKQYVDRVNHEYLKLAVRGITIVVASGDAGAPGRTSEECEEDRPVNPVFPGSSPYVTSVGATAVPDDGSIRNFTSHLCLQEGCVSSDREFAISFDHVGWTAGGGFDIYHNETPSWQKKAVRQYLASGVHVPPTSHTSGRAYPDVSAIGHVCPTYIYGSLMGVDGTSCSAPIVAGLLGNLDRHLQSTRQIRLGFANPLLYTLHDRCPNCFRDIVNGHNWCTEETCCVNTTDHGYIATTGYDPVSGLGTLNIGNIIEFLKSI